MSLYDVGPEEAVQAQVEASWGLPVLLIAYCPQHVQEERWMSNQVYRIAGAVSMEFDWEFYNSDSDDCGNENIPGFYRQDSKYRKAVQREVADAEAHMYTMKLLYDYVFDAVPDMTERVLADASLIDQYVRFFMDAIGAENERRFDADSDVPVSNYVPDSPEYVREARGILGASRRCGRHHCDESLESTDGH